MAGGNIDSPDWQEKLTPEQYHVLREKGTEAPYSGALLYNDDAGSYTCAACGNVLFRSDTKFTAHCGWPSFNDAVPGSIVQTPDSTLGMSRTEVTCAQCGGHLGHLFDDAPDQPTGMRYCINSVALQFLPQDGKK